MKEKKHVFTGSKIIAVVFLTRNGHQVHCNYNFYTDMESRLLLKHYF